MALYGKRIEEEGSEQHLFVIISMPGGDTVDVEVSQTIMDALDDLQREFWRLRKRDQRHAAWLDAIPENLLPASMRAEDPFDTLVRRSVSEDLVNAFLQIPAKQRRRMLLRHLFDLSIKQIARIEGCSERSVKYSLHYAKKNLRAILGEDFLI